MRPLATLVVLVTALALGTVPSAAATSPQLVCAKSKLNASSSTTSKRLGCYANAAGKGVGVDPTCVSKLETKFLAAFTKADGKGGCVPSGDGMSVESLIDACVDAIRTPLGTSGTKNPCLKMKLAAAGKKAAAKLKCSAKVAAKGQLADAACLAKAEEKYAKAWQKAEDKGGCVTMGDAADIEAVVDGDCVDPVVGALPVPTPVPSATATPLPTGTATVTATATGPTATPTPVACTETAPPTWQPNLTAQNDVRAGAQPPPNPALDPYCWKATVAATAQGWADGCTYAHNPNLGMLGLGENIYACASSSGPPCLVDPITHSVTSWADEVDSYDYPTNSCSQACQGGANAGASCGAQSECPGGLCSNVCGHYTQLVWRSTTHVGCGIKDCTMNSPFGPSFPNWTLVVCDYQPPGNFTGQRPY